MSAESIRKDIMAMVWEMYNPRFPQDSTDNMSAIFGAAHYHAIPDEGFPEITTDDVTPHAIEALLPFLADRGLNRVFEITCNQHEKRFPEQWV